MLETCFKHKSLLNKFHVFILIKSFQMMASNSTKSDGNVSSENFGETSHQCHHKEDMEKLWRTGVQSDVKIYVKDKTFDCHKTILVAASSYFEAMFSSGMREATSGEIKFHDMEPNIMENILAFIYTGNNYVTEENVIDVLETSLLLGIKTVSKMCENVLQQKLNVENCMEILELSYTHNCEGLKSKILASILDNFMNVMEQKNFFNLQLNVFIQLIKSDELNVISEETVLESVLKWTEKNEENAREENLNQLLPHLRLGHLSSETLLSLKTQGFLVSADVQAKLDEALEYKILSARRQEMQSTVRQYRKSFPFEEIMVVVGTTIVDGRLETKETSFFALSFLQQKWFKLPNIPYTDIKVAACCHGNNVFLFGGRKEHSKDVQRYNAATNKWKVCTCMFESRSSCAVVAITDVIYLIGGVKTDDSNDPDYIARPMILSSIEKYDIASGRSDYCTDLPKRTYLSSTAVSGRKVFIFGEIYISDDSESTHSCYMWNIVTNQFTCFTELADRCHFLRTVQSDRRIFIVKVDGIFEFKEEEGDCKLLGKKTNLRQVYYGTVAHRGHILIIGARIREAGAEFGLSSGIMHFNTETFVMTNYSYSLPTPMLLNGCFKIEIDKRFLTNRV